MNPSASSWSRLRLARAVLAAGAGWAELEAVWSTARPLKAS